MSLDFNSLNLPPKLLQALARMNFTTPTPIQEQAIPLGLAGRDVLGSAQTGTGKTAAFGIPLIARLMASPTAAAIVMTPTRELAGQVLAALQQMIPTPDIRTALLIGGEAMPRQFRQLQARPRLIVGTPGRINDHLARGTLKLNNCGFLVLDEMDRMLDMGFGVQIDNIVKHMPSVRQTLLFSATMPPAIVKIAAKYTKDAARISVGSSNQATPKVRQEMIQVSETEKHPKLLEILGSNEMPTIVFIKTKYGTEKMAKRLSSLNFRVDALHGDLRQSKRDSVVQAFRDKRFRILVATDVAARGLDISHIEQVINYDLPQAPEDYIHRVGRTARAGAEGLAINLVTPADGAKWRAIHRLMNPGEKAPFEAEARRSNGKPANRNGKPSWKKGGPARDGDKKAPQKWSPHKQRANPGEARTVNARRG